MSIKPEIPKDAVYSVGHSNHPPEFFVGLLRQFGIEAVADVRSQPYSRYSPQFNKDELKALIEKDGIKYVFMGRELGGRPEGEDFYDEGGRVLYDRLAASELFREGIARLDEGRRKLRVAMMCSEEDPRVCHRHLLIARVLTEQSIPVVHLRADGRLQDEADLRVESGEDDSIAQLDMFAEEKKPAWKSLRSVLPKKAPESSSEF